MKLNERCSGRGFDSRQLHQKYIGTFIDRLNQEASNGTDRTES